MKKLLAVLTACTVLAAPCTAGWAEVFGPAKTLEEKGIIEGDQSGDLNLESNVTRGEFIKMMVRALGLTERAAVEFSDLPRTHWAWADIQAAVKAGMIQGFEDGSVRPEAPVTYEQAAKMVLAAFDPWAVRGSAYPAGYIAAAIEYGFLDGVEALTDEELTRQDAIQMIHNALQIQEEKKTLQESADSLPVSLNGGGGGGAVNGSNTVSLASPMLADSGGAMASQQYAPEPGITVWPGIPFDTEEYDSVEENRFKSASLSPLSTFSIDVDTASYSNMRRFLMHGEAPAPGSIRTEELVNYFDYSYPEPEEGVPFSLSTQVGGCPWNDAHQLAMIAIKGAELPKEQRGPSNLVFLLDVSGSMESANKLPLVQRSMELLLDQLDERDTVSVVTYASGTQVVLDSVCAAERETILKAVYGLRAGGATAGSDGLTLAYGLAEKNLSDGNNRIILCTDGDFNVGPSSTAELEQMVEQRRESGIYLSVLGFGMGNYKDNRMEILADKGNGNYAYIDSLREAKKVLADEMTQTLYTIARDVKLQVEWNPAAVKEYRLIGYENRRLENEDFADDTKDAGELGAGAAVTALYELVPADGTAAEELRYQKSALKPSGELLCVRLRYKEPDGDESRLIEHPVEADTEETPNQDFYFASAVAELGMLLNQSEYSGTSSLDSVIELARRGMDEDQFGLRHELIQLADLMRIITK